ncbi:hypothetical protein PoB_006873900 [Plakobranchus ocellatus]|uniref:Uncharacterized protein n=1 Tax=Plakobranchus ocellatus TaxID=259542 RepID=A0AAV4DDG9_9GAST|nr:hypothetical protein PoB_006873900 [Plakobranchus ocellatus]
MEEDAVDGDKINGGKGKDRRELRQNKVGRRTEEEEQRAKYGRGYRGKKQNKIVEKQKMKKAMIKRMDASHKCNPRHNPHCY